MTSPHKWEDVLSYQTHPGMGPYCICRDIYTTNRDWVYRVKKGGGYVEEVLLPWALLARAVSTVEAQRR